MRPAATLTSQRTGGQSQDKVKKGLKKGGQMWKKRILVKNMKGTRLGELRSE
jgi:hypothetical protein